MSIKNINKRWKRVSEKSCLKYMTRGGSPQGASPNVKYVAFWGYFSCIPISRTSIPLPFSPHSFPYLFHLSFLPAP